MHRELRRPRLTISVIAIGLLATPGWGQKISNIDRDRAQDMLKEISSDIRKHYYDPKLHGVNWDAQVETAKQRINSTDSMNRALSEVAAALDSLNDSHTFFLPPSHSNHYDCGWEAQMVGEHCLVTEVRPGSDAEKKGVRQGDELVALNGFTPSRDNLWKMEYVFRQLRPQPVLRLSLRDPGGKQRQMDATTTVVQNKRVKDLTGRSSDNDIWDLVREGERDR